MNSFIKYLFTPLLLCCLCLATVLTGCSADEKEVQRDAFGYVQFKVYKGTSAKSKGIETRSGTILEKLNDAKKLKVVLLYDGNAIEQTMMLNSFDAENAEFGLRSDKLKLLSGDYKLIGYYLYDKSDNEIYTGTTENLRFFIEAGGLQVQELWADAVARGKVGFKLVKNGLTRANGYEDYPFYNIRCVSITVKNLFTQELTTIEKLKVRMVENLRESYAVCDTSVWLKAGSYKISSYSTYSDKKGTKFLETAKVSSSETFFVKDNEECEAKVPILLSKTAEYLKDYMALKAIWEALDGEHWSYYGQSYPIGVNWNFDKEIDLWGEQPGVQVLDNGRVAALSLSGFGAKGVVPDAIGQLTELRILLFGTHNDMTGRNPIGDTGLAMTEEQRMSIRTDYEKKFLYRDSRENLSDILIDGINANPQFEPIKKSSRIEKKDVNFGNLTNKITGISKALMRCTKLQNFFIANSLIKEDEFCTKLVDDPQKSDFRKAFGEEESEWSWKNFTTLTDVEIYNCPSLTSLPMDMLKELPELQLLNVSCNKNIPGDTLLKNWEDLIYGSSGDKIQVLYLGHNNLTQTPEYGTLKLMTKLGLLDLTYNQIEKVHAFGKDINLVKVYLDHNKINELEKEDGYFCGYYDMENFSCTHNELTEIPDIFNAASKYIIASVSFSHNNISGAENGENHRGINATNLDLSYNRLKEFPGVLIHKGSPLSILNLTGNGMETIKAGDLIGKNSRLLTTLDFKFNKLKKIPFEDFVPENLPYIFGIEFSYNQFSDFPVAPLNCQSLTVFGIRHQRDDKGNRCLRQWPTGLFKCASLSAFFIGSNDLRKIDDYISPFIRVFEIKDNPNISINLSSVCPYIKAGQYKLIYDKTQNIQGCDILLD